MSIPQSLLSKVKKSLRISHTVLDDDILDNIAACVADLRTCGIADAKLDIMKELDPLILNAVKLYCKKEYTDDPTKAARFQEGYDSLKSFLMMASGYGREEELSDE